MTDVKKHREAPDYSQVLDCSPDQLDKLQILRPGALLVYVHLPKAAGNSSILALRHHFSAYVDVNWRKPKEHVEEIVANWNDNPVSFISGHIDHGALETIRTSEIPHACVTFLRHPVERIVSTYWYTSSPKAPGYEEFLNRHPTLEHFVFEAVLTNEISRFMLGKDVQSLEDYKAEMKRFSFIGVSELLPLSHKLICRGLNIPFSLPGRANVTEYPKGGRDLSQRLLDYLYMTQQMDIMFHTYIMNKYCAIASQIIGDSPDACERLSAERLSV